MPARSSMGPERIQPTPHGLLEAIQARDGMATLRELCGAAWIDLPWAGAAGCDNALRPRAALGGMSAAHWLLDRLQDMVVRGLLAYGPRRRDEVSALAGVTFIACSTSSPSATTQRMPRPLLGRLLEACQEGQEAPEVAHAA